jgi:glycosyltransferase involved in cell wall biosynthesis
VKVLFVIKTLSIAGGGAERVLAAISAELARRGHEVIVATFDHGQSGTFYPFSSRIRLVHLAIGDVTKRTGPVEFLKRTRTLRNLAAQLRPDVAVGFMHSSYIPLALALSGTGIPAIGSAHSVYEHYRGRPVDRLGLRIAGALLQRFTAISDRMRNGFPPYIGKKMVLIPNPTIAPERFADVRLGQSKTVLCVGRLGPEKDHATLISAFAGIADRFQDWRLRIVGEGALRPALEQQIERLRLNDRVQLPGAVARISEEYAAAQLFVLPSRYESYGLATAEAMMHGLPVIGFADCPGTNEMVRQGVNGILVPGSDDRVAALGAAMARLMDSPAERKRLGDAARDVTFESIGAIARAWEQLLESVAGDKLVTKQREPKLGTAHRR